MNSRKFNTFAGIALALLFVLGISSSIAAQGRGGGGRPSGSPGNSGNAGGSGMGRGNSGVARGVNTSSNNSNGRSDRGRDTASNNSNGRSDDGMNRAREGGMNRNMPSGNELNRYRGIARKLNTTPENLRSQYESALAANPDLKFGQFVAANMISNNLNSRFPNITSAAILGGLQNGNSIGETLHNLGLGKDEARDIEKQTKREIKERKKQN